MEKQPLKDQNTGAASEGFRNLIESLPDMVVSLEYPSGRVLFVNHAVKVLLGYEPAQMYDSNFFLKIVHPDERRGLLNLWRGLEEGDDFPIFLYRVKKSDGNYIWVEQKNRVLHGPDGRVNVLNSLIRDITERKRLEQEALQSLYFSENLFQISPYAIIHVDEDGRILRINPNFEKLWHLSLGDMTAYRLWNDGQLMRSGITDILRNVTRGQIAEIPPFAYKIPFKGTTRTVFLSGKGFAYLNNAGDVSGLILVVDDVTDRVKRDEEYLEVKKLESIGRLAGGIAHDFNNILAGISGYSEILMRKMEKDDPRSAYAQKIYNAARKASILTDQLLGFARRGKYNPDYIDIISPIIFAIGATPGLNSGMRIEKSFQKSDLKVFADAGQLRQLFVEIFKNAVDAGGQDTHLEIRTEYVSSENIITDLKSAAVKNFVKIVITDYGEGIDESILGKIFEPYFTTRDKAKHAGMGLSIAYGIVKNHGGRIDLVRRAEGGTVAVIYLPAVEKPQGGILLRDGRIQRVLIIDDNEETRSFLRAFFEEKGSQVHEASSGRAGIEFFRSGRVAIDLVLLDLIIPDISGKEVLATLKNIRNEVKVILISGYYPDRSYEEYMKDPTVRLLLKPFSLEELEALIDIAPG
mgnify:CR=1 FL=1